MKKPREPFSEEKSDPGVHPVADDPLLSSRQRQILRRISSILLLLILLLFWWSFVYTAWSPDGGCSTAISFWTEEQNPFVWNGVIDWIFMILALLTVWPAQRWLRIQIAHFVEDKSDDPYAIFSQIAAQIDGAQIDRTQTPDTEMSSLVHLLARTLDVPYVSIETEPDGLSADYGTPPRRLRRPDHAAAALQSQPTGEAAHRPAGDWRRASAP